MTTAVETTSMVQQETLLSTRCPPFQCMQWTIEMWMGNVRDRAWSSKIFICADATPVDHFSHKIQFGSCALFSPPLLFEQTKRKSMIIAEFLAGSHQQLLKLSTVNPIFQFWARCLQPERYQHIKTVSIKYTAERWWWSKQAARRKRNFDKAAPSSQLRGLEGYNSSESNCEVDPSKCRTDAVPCLNVARSRVVEHTQLGWKSSTTWRLGAIEIFLSFLFFVSSHFVPWDLSWRAQRSNVCRKLTLNILNLAWWDFLDDL